MLLITGFFMIIYEGIAKWLENFSVQSALEIFLTGSRIIA